MNAPAKRLRVLLVGLGSVGQRHARNLRLLFGDEVELNAFRTRRSPAVVSGGMRLENGVDVEAQLGLRVFSNLEEALAERPDVAVIANPTSLHLASARTAAEAGCHLFIEKPLSHSMDGLPEFVEFVESKGLVTVIGYQWRFHPLMNRVRDALAEGVLGRVVSVLAEFGEWLPGWHPYEDYRQSYAARRELGGGVLLTQIHDFDYLGWLFGWPRRLFCSGGKLSDLEIDVEDTANSLLECQWDGRLLPIHVHQDFLQRPPVRGCRILGINGVIELDLAASVYRRTDAAGTEVERVEFETYDRNDMFLDAMRHFIACVTDGETSKISAREGAKSLCVAHSALESLRTARVVELPLL